MKIVIQDGIKDCGVCSLLSIIRYYGGEVSKEYLRELTNTTKQGTSAYHIIKAARIIGFDSIGVTGELENIELNNLPCIAHVTINKKYQHFIVIYKIDYKKEKILVMDPSKGKDYISFIKFKLISSKNYILLKPIKKLPVMSKKQIMITITKKTLKKSKKNVLFIYYLTITYFIFNIITAFHFKIIINNTIKYNINYNLMKVSIVLLIIYILKEISLFYKNILLIKLSEVLDQKLSFELYNQIILLPYLYYRNRTTGEIISRIKDLNVIKEYIVKLFSSITTDLLTIIIFIIIMFNLNKKLTIIVLLLNILLFTTNIILSKTKKKKLKTYYKNEDILNNYLVETLASPDAIKGIHIENDIISKYKVRYKKYLESIYNLSVLEDIEIFIKNNISNILQIIIILIGSEDIIRSKISMEDLIIYQGILNYYLYSSMNLFELYKNYHSFKISLNRIEDIFTINKEKFNGSNYYKMYNLKGDIIYKNLSYSFNSKKLYDNLSLKIKYGEKILLCGKSGSGKSTLTKLLVRYLEIPYGYISINNIDINHYHIDKLRNNITYVSQQEYLFTNSIYNNIVLNRNVDSKKISKILKLTLVDKILEKNKLNIESLVEENGFNFSGGERQRIILARALVKESDIYIFDEALNQIDVENEKIILENIFKYLKNKTIIVISHRFNNNDLFDKVLSLEKGKINEIKL